MSGWPESRVNDAALQRGDPQAVGQFWADEYTFVNPAGERLTKAARMANLSSRRTAFDTLRPKLQDEQIRVYADVVVYTTLTTLAGRYGGRAHQGDYQALVVLVKRDGQWQQVASQLPGEPPVAPTTALEHAARTAWVKRARPQPQVRRVGHWANSAASRRAATAY